MMKVYKHTAFFQMAMFNKSNKPMARNVMAYYTAHSLSWRYSTLMVFTTTELYSFGFKLPKDKLEKAWSKLSEH